MAYRRSEVYMDTVVTIAVTAGQTCAPDVARAFSWFAEVEARCSRFDPASELRRLCLRPGEPLPVSPVLFEALRVALAVAQASGGAFDPTVGAAMEARGYTRDYRTGISAPSGLPAPPGPGDTLARDRQWPRRPAAAACAAGETGRRRIEAAAGHSRPPAVAVPADHESGRRRIEAAAGHSRPPVVAMHADHESGRRRIAPDPGRPRLSARAPRAVRAPGWRRITLDPARRTVCLHAPLLIDLGAVAKGLAIDLAAHELRAWPGFVVEAGGDLLARGGNASGQPWRIGVRHPRHPGALCALLAVDGAAVCTSGDYVRGRHLVDARGGGGPESVASCTVIAPHAVLADALATAAAVMGPERGIEWLKEQGVDALMITPELRRLATPGLAEWERW